MDELITTVKALKDDIIFLRAEKSELIYTYAALY